MRGWLALGAVVACACSSAPEEPRCVAGECISAVGGPVPPDAAPPVDAAPEVDGGKGDTGAPPDAAPQAAVAVTFTWSYFLSRSQCSQGQPPVACTSKSACASGTTCTCKVCGGVGQPCVPSQLIPRCCTKDATSLEGDIAQLATDYPKCTLVRTGGTATLDCGPDSDPLVTFYDGGPLEDGPRLLGAAPKHTSKCDWNLPYAVK